MSMNVNAGVRTTPLSGQQETTSVQGPPTLETAQSGTASDAPRTGGKFKAAMKSVGDFFKAIGTGIADLAKTVGTGIKNAAIALKDSVVNFFDKNAQAKADLQEAFQPHLDGLESEHNPLGSFLRGNDGVSRGLQRLGGDQAQYAPSVTKSYEGLRDDVIGVVPDLGEPNTEDYKLNAFGKFRTDKLTTEDYGRIFDVSGQMMDDLFDTDPRNEKSLMSQMPSVYKEQLSVMSEKILAKDNLTPDEKREALHTLYNDVVLRKAIPALMVTASKLPNGPEKSSMMMVAAAIQAVANDVQEIKWVKEGGATEAKPLYTEFFEAKHGMIDDFFRAMGMPEVPDTV